MGKSSKGVLFTITVSILLLGYYHYTEAKAWWSFPLYNDGLRSGEVGDKVIVMARLASEDTSWVAEHLPNWQRAIYTVDDSSSLLQTPVNKGHESMAYLTYVISNYHKLPSTVVFLHAHRSGYRRGWHTDAWDHDNVRAVQSLNLSYVQESGYVNLRCNWGPGCKPENYTPNGHVTKQVWMDVFHSENRTEDEVPEMVGQACCAQFAVSREQVMKRPLEDYVSYRQWVIDTDLSDYESGRVMEYLWHVIFGKEAVFCPEEKTCYCKVYGRCD